MDKTGSKDETAFLLYETMRVRQLREGANKQFFMSSSIESIARYSKSRKNNKR